MINRHDRLSQQWNDRCLNKQFAEFPVWMSGKSQIGAWCWFKKLWRLPVSEIAMLATINAGLLSKYYRSMLELRFFEQKAQELYRNGLLPGFVHLYLGEEAVAVGVCSNLETRDMVFSTHRGHGHALAKGVPARLVLAEL